MNDCRRPAVLQLQMYPVNVNPVEVASKICHLNGLLPNPLEKFKVSKRWGSLYLSFLFFFEEMISVSFSAGKHCQRGRNVVRLSCILDG